jgi:hypothetical protein
MKNNNIFVCVGATYSFNNRARPLEGRQIIVIGAEKAFD